jgi:hypothetical protein
VLLPKEVDPETASIAIEYFIKEKSRNVNFRKGILHYYSENYNADHNYKSFLIHLRVK